MASPPSSTPPSATRNETAEHEGQSISAMLTPAPTSPFNVFAFSVPPPSQGRRGSEQSYAKYSTAASTRTPYSQPLQTPGDDQPLPLPYPGPRRRSSVRETETQPATTAPRTTATPHSFTYSLPPSQPERPDDEQDQSSSELPPISSAGNSSTGPATRDPRVPDSDKEAELEASNKDSEVWQAPNDRSQPQPEDDTNADQREEDSPFEEVRACVSNTDDPDMPTTTFRMWFIGLTLCSIASSWNLVLSLRFPSVFLSPLVILLVAHVMGKVMEHLLPIRLWFIPDSIPWIGGSAFTLNPGPFSIKEHALIYIMSSCPISVPYSLNFVLTARKYYNVELSPGFFFCLHLSTVALSYSFGWLTQRIFVKPSNMLWPTTLLTSSLLNTLHAGNAEEKLRLTRIKFFSLITGLSALYYFIPGFLFTGLSYFSFVCWLFPKNVVVNQLFGTVSGLGMGVLTFDWAQISFIGSPLLTPWWAAIQSFIGFVLFYWVILPILYYTNSFKTGHLPIMGYVAYDRFGLPYSLDQILNQDRTFNATAYAEYSPLYIPVSLLVTYLTAFVLATAFVIATILDFGDELWKALKGKQQGDDDVHARLMRIYPEIPALWYTGVFVVSFTLAVAAIQIGHFDLPIWGVLLAASLVFIYSIPALYVYSATTGIISINLLAQIIPGSIWPGNPSNNMLFKTFCVQWLSSAMTFTECLKIGHYLKIPPRHAFMVQIISAIVMTSVQTGTQKWLLDAVPDLCDPNQKGRLICPSQQVFYTASLIYEHSRFNLAFIAKGGLESVPGVIGPRIQFSKGGMQEIQVYGLVAGAIAPLLVWVCRRKFRIPKYRRFSLLFIVSSMGIPPATGINYSSWFFVAFLFQYLVRTRYYRWWFRYNYITGAALQTGTMIGAILVFLLLQLPKSSTLELEWWGNTVWKKTADALGTPYYPTDSNIGF